MSLFIRTPQRANLTPEGRVLYEQVSNAMAEVQAGLARLSEVAAQRRGHVKIACAPTLASTRLGRILVTFKLRYPRSLVDVKETPPTAALTLLQEQEVELYIGPQVSGLSDFQFEPILEDHLVACVPADFDDGAQSFLLSEVANYPLILLDRQTASRALIDRISADQSLTLNMQYEVQNAYTAIALASAGLGVALVPEIAVPMLPAAEFRVVRIADPHRALPALMLSATSAFAAQSVLIQIALV